MRCFDVRWPLLFSPVHAPSRPRLVLPQRRRVWQHVAPSRQLLVIRTGSLPFPLVVEVNPLPPTALIIQKCAMEWKSKQKNTRRCRSNCFRLYLSESSESWTTENVWFGRKKMSMVLADLAWLGVWFLVLDELPVDELVGKRWWVPAFLLRTIPEVLCDWHEKALRNEFFVAVADSLDVQKEAKGAKTLSKSERWSAVCRWFW